MLPALTYYCKWCLKLAILICNKGVSKKGWYFTIQLTILPMHHSTLFLMDGSNMSNQCSQKKV